MPDPRRVKGNHGEDLAAAALEKRGYQILVRNYRSRAGEIDIIARDGSVLVFVEVKTRHGDRFGPPKAAVTRAKQKKISLVALEYLSRTQQLRKAARFDVVAIRHKPDATEIEIIQNAFESAFP